jgi:hydrogenase maturation protease
MNEANRRAVVVGLGNPLMGDDGLGLAALDRLRRRGAPGADIELVDGGTWGLRLLPVLEEADAAILLDAIDDGRRPGTLIVLEREDVPARLGHKLSAHEADLRELFALMALRGTLPQRLVAIGLQPERVEFGAPLSAAAESGLATIVSATLARLAAWEYHLELLDPAIGV